MRRLVKLATLLAGGCALAPAAFALDCAAPGNPVDTTICADPDLKAAEDAMTAAYDAALAKLPPDWQATLSASQAAFLKQRADYCGQEEGRKDCILSRTQPRADYLAAKPESGPGTADPLLPFTAGAAQSEKTCAFQVDVHKFAAGPDKPGEAAFDAAVQKAIDNAAGEWSKRESTPDFEYDCNYNLTSAITYASPDLIAGEIFFDAYQGGAHGIYGRIPIVVDLKTGKSPVAAELFDKAAQEKLAAQCTEAIKAEKLSRSGEVDDAETRKQIVDGLEAEMKDYAGTIAEHVGDFADWLVYEDRAEIYFGPYEVGAYAEGDFTCALPKADLQAAAGAKGWIVP